MSGPESTVLSVNAVSAADSGSGSLALPIQLHTGIIALLIQIRSFGITSLSSWVGNRGWMGWKMLGTPSSFLWEKG